MTTYDYKNPSAETVRKFVAGAEGNPESGIYHDNSEQRYPTHGLGINLQGKSAAFVRDYISVLNDTSEQIGKLDPDKVVKHYVYNETESRWAVDETTKDKTLLAEINWLTDNDSQSWNPNTPKLPFVYETSMGIDHDDEVVRLVSTKNQNEQAFDRVVYPAYLTGKSTDDYQIEGVIEAVGESIWNGLNEAERLALYSLNYNAGSLIGEKLKNALNLYVNGTDEDAKFIGKLEAWYQILYASNSSNSKGVQNRRFMEACAFMGEVLDELPTPETAYCAISGIDSYHKADIVVAYMNWRLLDMKAKLSKISGYKVAFLSYIQAHFVEAVQKFLQYKEFPETVEFDKLFQTWNLYTDSWVANSSDKPFGYLGYKGIEGDDLDDIVYISGDRQDLQVNVGNGNNIIYGGCRGSTISCGDGNDVIYSFEGNDVIFPGNGNNFVDLKGYPIWKKVYITNSTFGTDRIINFDPAYHDYDYPLGYLSAVEEGNVTTIITEGGNKIIIEEVE